MAATPQDGKPPARKPVKRAAVQAVGADAAPGSRARKAVPGPGDAAEAPGSGPRKVATGSGDAAGASGFKPRKVAPGSGDAAGAPGFKARKAAPGLSGAAGADTAQGSRARKAVPGSGGAAGGQPAPAEPGPVAPISARHNRGFRTAGASARTPLTAVAAKAGFAVPDLLIRWAEVVGAALSGLCHPVKVSYATNREMGATLLVQVQGARAPEVEHLAPRIVERVNQFYGYRAISRLRITQATGLAGQAAGFAETASPFLGPQRPVEPGPEVTARAAALAAGIQDPDLREALTRMGAHVLARSAANRRGPG